MRGNLQGRTVVLACALAAVGAAAFADGVGVRAVNGDKLSAAVDAPGDGDSFALDLHAAGKFSATIKVAKGSTLLPTLRLFRPGGAAQSLPPLTGAGTGKVSLKNFVVPEGETGTWRALVEGTGGSTGGYELAVKWKPPKKVAFPPTLLGPGEERAFEFPLEEGASFKALVKSGKGEAAAASVEFAGPEGSAPGEWNVVAVLKGTSHALTGTPASATPAAAGTATLIVTADAAGGTYTPSVVLKFAKAAKRTALLPTEASVGGVSPSTLRQSSTGTPLAQSIDVSGSDFLPGTVLRQDGAEPLSATTFVSSALLRVTMSVPEDAPFGTRDLLLCPPELSGEPLSLAAAVQVRAPIPTLSSVSPAVLKQGEAGVVLTVTGTGFRAGGSITLEGAGLTLGSTTVVTSTQAQVTVTVNSAAAVGARDVTFTQPAAGGGADVVRTDGIQVHYPDPTLASVSPADVTQGVSSIQFTLTGTGFRDGGIVTLGGDIGISGAVRLSDTQYRVTLAVDAAAALGARDVTYTQPADGGSASKTLAGGLVVSAPTPTLTTLSGAVLRQGAVASTLTVNGTNFRDGGAISISGAGLTLGTTTIVSATQATVPVTVGAAAAVGLRDVTYTQPVTAGGLTATKTNAFQVLYPIPTVASVSPAQWTRGETTKPATITGTGFRTGGVVTTSGAGLTLASVVVVNDTTITLNYSVDGAAALGFRSLTYTQPADGGADAATKASALEVFPVGPEVTAVTPSAWIPGTPRFNVALTGVNFNSGTSTSLSGAGVTIHSTTFVSSTALTLLVSVDSAAALGLRDLTVTPGAGGGAPKAFTGAVAIAGSAPRPASLSIATLAQGATSLAVTVRGSGFRSGDTLAASGSGVTFASVSVTDSETITALVTATGSATTGARDLTVTHASSSGGLAGTLEGAFSVVGGTPTVSTVTPGTLGRTAGGGATREFAVVVTGTNFSGGATLTASRTGGSGVSVKSGSESVTSSSSMAATLAIAGGATAGTWDLKVTNPGGGNGTGSGILDIKTESTLVVNAVSPSSGTAHGGERVTVYGSGFSAGATVDFGAVAAGGTQVIDGNTIVTTAPVPASLSKTAGTTVAVKVTNPGGGNASLASAYTYAADSGAPMIVSTFPADLATGVPTNLRKYVFILNEPLALSSLGAGDFDFFGSSSQDITSPRILSFAAPAGTTLVVVERGVVSGGGSNAPNLAKSSVYAADINSGAQDLAGNAFTPLPFFSGSIYRASFTTGTTTDATAPTLSSSVPASSATGVAVTTAVSLVFSEELDPATVDLTNITFKQSSTTVPAAIALGTDLRTVTITPLGTLAASTTYTTAVTTAVKDLSGNAVAATVSRTFTTAASDGIVPTVDAVVFEDIRSDMDGSTTWVSGTDTDSNGNLQSAGSTVGFDLYLPRAGWEVVVRFSDAGGAGIDTSTFSAKASVAVGSASANAELASQFQVTPTEARWRVPATGTVPGFTTGEDVTLTFLVKDRNANTSLSKVVTFDVVDKDGSATGSGSKGGATGGDHDPLDARQTWILRGDLDAYTASYATSGSDVGATSTISSNSIPDLDEALRLIGLNTGSMTTAAAATMNGTERGTNAIVRQRFLDRVRASLRAHFGIAEDGVRDAGSVDIEFLLPGEQGALTSMPAYSAANAFSSGKAFSEISIGGPFGAEGNAFTTGPVLGLAWIDARNTRQEANLNFGSGGNTTGIFLMGMLKLQVNDSSATLFGGSISDVFVTARGGKPVGEDALDDNVLADTFDRTSGGNSAAENVRYDAIMDAVELVAFYVGTVTAHEIGHSTGLVADGAPKPGLFGNAHRSNSFTEATSANPNTSFHLNYPGVDIMAPSVGFETAVATGTDFPVFNPVELAYLRNRSVIDEGK